MGSQRTAKKLRVITPCATRLQSLKGRWRDHVFEPFVCYLDDGQKQDRPAAYSRNSGTLHSPGVARISVEIDETFDRKKSSNVTKEVNDK